jgi:hypothetical protein
VRIADTIKSTLREVLGATAYEVITLHMQSRTGVDFSRPETVVGNVRVLEGFLHQTFRDSANSLLDKAGNNLLATFSLPDYNTFQYSQTGDLAALVEKILKRSDSLSILSDALDKDHFIMSYTHRQELPSIIAAFLQRGVQNNCVNVLAISEDEKRRLVSFLKSSQKLHHGKNTTGLLDEHVIIVTHDELYGDLDSISSMSFQPFMDILNQARQLAIQKQMSGLNVVGTVAGSLFSNGHYEECLQIENTWHETVYQFPMPITVMCLYEKPIDEPHQTPLLRCHNGGLHQI